MNPPVPHDEVVVDEGQDQEGLEKERPSKHMDERALGGKGQMVLTPAGFRTRETQTGPGFGGSGRSSQRFPEGSRRNGQPAIEPVKEDLGLGDRGVHPGPQAVP